MSKFDTLISTKLGQLNEVLTAAATTTGGATQPGLTGVATPNAQPGVTGQQPTQPTQPTQTEAPEQALTKIFQTLKFSDPNTAVKTLNTALKGAGNVPGISEFFGSLGYDPKTGFIMTQQKAAQGTTPAATAPGTQPLR